MSVDSLFLYSNSEIAYSYMSGRQIATPDLLPVRSFSSRSLGHMNNHFIFLTHKKLEKKYRTYGFDTEGDYQISPIVLKFDISSSYNQPAWLLSLSSNGKIKVELKKLSLYKPDKHFGAFVVAELPMSLVSSYLFETIEDIQSFNRPSPDLWFPRQMFSPLAQEEFIQELPCDIEALSKVMSIDAQISDSISMAAIRSRIRAMMWSSFYSMGWQNNNFRYTIDPIAQEAFGISDLVIDKLLPEYSSTKNEKYKNEIPFWTFDYSKTINRNNIDLIEAAKEEPKPINQTTGSSENEDSSSEHVEEKIYSIILKQYVKIRADLRKANDYWDSFLAEFASEASKIQPRIIDLTQSLSACVNMEVGCLTPEQYSKVVPISLYPLVSLLFVIRNSNNLNQLILDLKEYHANPLIAKTARLFWSFLNGMFDVPGEDYEKDNMELWNFIEQNTSSILKDDLLYSFKKPTSPKLNSGSLFGKEISSIRMASIRGIQQFFIEQVSSGNESATQACFQLLSGIVDCSRIAYKLNSSITLTESSLLSQQEYQKIVSSFERVTIPDSDKIIKVLNNTELFRDICKRNSSGWKAAYIQHIDAIKENQQKTKRRRK